MADCNSERLGGLYFGTGCAGSSINRVAQRDDTNIFGLVGYESGCKILAANAGPVVGAGESGAACDLLGGEMIVVIVGLKFELSGSISGNVGLIAKTSRPGRKGPDRSVVRED